MSVRQRHLLRFCLGRRSIIAALVLSVATLATACDSAPPAAPAPTAQRPAVTTTTKADPTLAADQSASAQYINYRYRDWQIAYPAGWDVRKADFGMTAVFSSHKDWPASIAVTDFDPGKTLAHAELVKSASKRVQEGIGEDRGYKEVRVAEEDGLTRLDFTFTDSATDDVTGSAYLFPHGRGYLLVTMIGPTDRMSSFEPIFKHCKESFIQLPKASK